MVIDLEKLEEDAKFRVLLDININAGIERAHLKLKFDYLQRSTSQRFRRAREERLHEFWALVSDLNLDPKYWAHTLI